MTDIEETLRQAIQDTYLTDDQIIANVDVERLLTEYSAKLKHVDGRLQIRWPKSNDLMLIAGPMMSYDPKQKRFYGANGWQGDVIDVMALMWFTNRETAAMHLASDATAWRKMPDGTSTGEDKPRQKHKQKPIETTNSALADGTLLEALYNPETETSSFAIRKPDGEITTARDFSYKGRRYVPLCDKLVRRGIVLLPSEIGKLKDEDELIDYTRGYIHAHVDVSETFEKIATYYVLLTWLYDNFTAIPYLRALGQHGTGKTRFLKTVGVVCYRPVFMGGAVSTASIYRMLELYHGTLLIDEADYVPKSEAWPLLLQVLNLGYEADAVVIRCTGNNFKPIPHNCFGPKIIAGRRPFQDKALNSRCLTAKFYPTQRNDIPLQIPRLIEWKDAREIRNMLLAWRLQHYNPHRESLGCLTGGVLEPRLEQIIRPLQAVLTSKAAKQDIEEFVKDYARRAKAELGQTLPGLILRAIAELLRAGQEPYYHLIADKAQPWLEDPEHKLTGRQVGTITRKELHLGSCQGTGNRTKVKIDKEAITHIQKLCQRYGLEELKQGELTSELSSVNLETNLTQKELRS